MIQTRLRKTSSLKLPTNTLLDSITFAKSNLFQRQFGGREASETQATVPSRPTLKNPHSIQRPGTGGAK
jgi:hypothetical protein